MTATLMSECLIRGARGAQADSIAATRRARGRRPAARPQTIRPTGSSSAGGRAATARSHRRNDGDGFAATLHWRKNASSLATSRASTGATMARRAQHRVVAAHRIVHARDHASRSRCSRCSQAAPIARRGGCAAQPAGRTSPRARKQAAMPGPALGGGESRRRRSARRLRRWSTAPISATCAPASRSAAMLRANARRRCCPSRRASRRRHAKRYASSGRRSSVRGDRPAPRAAAPRRHPSG